MSEKAAISTNFASADVDFEKGGGLVPAVVQDHDSGQVLMLGYMNQESLALTLETGDVTFYSRSREKLWRKGETSGHVLRARSLTLDCDRDSLLIQAVPLGPTCHTGSVSCFGDSTETQFATLPKLWAKIVERSDLADPSSSYTAKLLAEGVRRQAQKVGEEGVEVALAAVAEGDEALLGESADLLYHLLVLLRGRGLSFGQVCRVLAQRGR
ncbi:MAG: hypothetical protein RL011_843 [Pseudomonadota bacterium]